eukprot:Rmarinus@m.8552
MNLCGTAEAEFWRAAVKQEEQAGQAGVLFQKRHKARAFAEGWLIPKSTVDHEAEVRKFKKQPCLKVASHLQRPSTRQSVASKSSVVSCCSSRSGTTASFCSGCSSCRRAVASEQVRRLRRELAKEREEKYQLQDTLNSLMEEVHGRHGRRRPESPPRTYH